MPRVFPDSVTLLQKFTRKTLYLTRSLLHAGAFSANPIPTQDEAWFPSRNYAAHEKAEEKRRWGEELSSGIFKLQLSSHFFASKSEASTSRGRLRLAATAGLTTFKQPSRFYFGTAQLHLTGTQRLPVRLGTQHPVTALAPVWSKPQPRRQSRLPTAQTPLLGAAAGLAPAISPELS